MKKSTLLCIFILNITPLTILSMEKLEGWETKAYSPEILKSLIEMRSKQTPEQIKHIKDRCHALITQAYASIDQDPSSTSAQQIFKDWINLANEEYQGYDEVKAAKSTAYKNNLIPDSPFDQKLWEFLGKTAIYMYQNQ